MSGNRKSFLLGTGLAALFFYGILHLLAMRFGTGDVYPAYSSLRADPLGCKALYTSFDRIKSIRVDRSFEPLDQIPASPDTCLLFLGARVPRDLRVHEDWITSLERFLDAGNRLVIALVPKDSGHGTSHGRPSGDSIVDLFEYFGVSLVFEGKKGSANARAMLEIPSGHPADMAPVLFPFSQWFRMEAPEWQVMYSVNGSPVVIERPFSNGSVVLVADSYVFSNEALKQGGAAALAARVCDRPRIVFDEYHLGIQKRPGISTLIRKYHLFPVVIAVIGWMILFMWKQGSYFVPPDLEKERMDLAGSVPDKNHLSGLAGLLRHHIGPDQVLDQCVKEFKDAFVKGHPANEHHAGIYNEITRIMSEPGATTDPVAGYQTIYRIISKGNKNER